MSGKITRKVTVDKRRRLSSDGNTAPDQIANMKKRSVFDRLGTAGTSYDSAEKCRTFMRDGDCPFGSKCKYSHDIPLDTKRDGKEGKKYRESPDAKSESYQDTEKIPDKKKDRKKFMDSERLKIEFKKDNLLKKKQTIAELYGEEVPMRKSKKERKDKIDSSLVHSKMRKSFNDEMTIEKDIHVRNVQLRGEDGKHKKMKHESKFVDNYDEEQDLMPSKKHKKKRYQENDDEENGSYKEKADVATSKKKKKKKEKIKYSSGTSDEDIDDDQTKKKKTKKEKHRAYESGDSLPSSDKKKIKSHEYEGNVEEVKKKKKKKKDKYESETEEVSMKEESYKRDYEAERPKKNKKNNEKYASKVSQFETEQSRKKKLKSIHLDSPKSDRAKEKSKRSASWSFSSESSQDEATSEDEERKWKKKNKSKKSREEDRKDRDKKRSKHEDSKVSHQRHAEEKKEMPVDVERRRDHQSSSYAREHYTKQQFMPTAQEGDYDAWDREHAGYDDRQHQKNYESPANYGRGRGKSLYKDRHDVHSKGGVDDRQQYRQFQDQIYMSDQGRYRDRGTRDAHGYHANRRSGYEIEEESTQSGRSRQFFKDTSGFQPDYSQEDKARYRQQGNYIPGKDLEDSAERMQKHQPSHQALKEHKSHDSRSPKSKNRNFSPKEVGYDNEDERLRKKRKRDGQSAENEYPFERKKKKSKIDKSDSEAEYEIESKSDRGRKDSERGKKHSSRSHRDSESQLRKEDFSDEKRDRRSDKGSRERDSQLKRNSSAERSRKDKSSSRTDRKGESHSHDEGQSSKVEDKRVKALRSSHGRNSPSDRSDNEAGSKSQKRANTGKGTAVGPDGNDLSLEDVYEKISDDELDFFDEEHSKSQKPVSLEDMDWSALAAIAPASKINTGEAKDGETPRSKHTAINVLKTIGFSSKLLSKKTLDKIKEKCSEEAIKVGESKEMMDISDYVGIGSFVLSKMQSRDRRKNLIRDLTRQGTVLNMRKDIDIRKELQLPSNKIWLHENLFCNAPSSAADKELFMASVALYNKIQPGEMKSSCKILPSMVGSIIECCN